MVKRLAASAPLLEFNELTLKIKRLETDLEKEKDEKVKEEKGSELEAAKTNMAELEQTLAELKASFYDVRHQGTLCTCACDAAEHPHAALWLHHLHTRCHPDVDVIYIQYLRLRVLGTGAHNTTPVTQHHTSHTSHTPGAQLPGELDERAVCAGGRGADHV